MINSVETKYTWLQFISIFLVFLGLHIVIVWSFLELKNISLIGFIHLFLFLLLFVTQFISKKVKIIDPNKVGMAFLAMTLFKMLLSVGLLFLLFSQYTLDQKQIVFHFFIPFFIYLLFEVMLSLKVLR